MNMNLMSRNHKGCPQTPKKHFMWGTIFIFPWFKNYKNPPNMDVSKSNFIPSVNLSHTEIKEMAKRDRIILNWYIFIFKLDLDSLTCNWNIREEFSFYI